MFIIQSLTIPLTREFGSKILLHCNHAERILRNLMGLIMGQVYSIKNRSVPQHTFVVNLFGAVCSLFNDLDF